MTQREALRMAFLAENSTASQKVPEGIWEQRREILYLINSHYFLKPFDFLILPFPRQQNKTRDPFSPTALLTITLPSPILPLSSSPSNSQGGKRKVESEAEATSLAGGAGSVALWPLCPEPARACAGPAPARPRGTWTGLRRCLSRPPALLTFEPPAHPRSPPVSVLHTLPPRSLSSVLELSCPVLVYSLQVEHLTLCPDLHPNSLRGY